MRHLLGAIELRSGVGQPLPLFDGPASEPRRSMASRHAGVTRLSFVTVVADLQSELRRRRHAPTERTVTPNSAAGNSTDQL
jgi:hypothetical protein